MYASPGPAARRVASDHYADVSTQARVLGASPHQLVGILFDEVMLSLAVAGKAAARGDLPLRESRRERALTLLAALRTSLDHEHGGSLAVALDRVYAASDARIRAAGGATDPGGDGFRDAQGWIADIAAAWNAIG